MRHLSEGADQAAAELGRSLVRGAPLVADALQRGEVAALEEPEALVAEIRSFFRELR